MPTCNTGGAKIPVSEAQVSNQVLILRSTVDRLDEAVGKLSQRLGSVTIDATADPLSDKPDNELVPLAHEIREENSRLDILFNNLRSLIDRIEL